MGTLGTLMWRLGRPWGGSWVVPEVPRVGPRQSWGVRSGHFNALWGRMGLDKGAGGLLALISGAFDCVSLYNSAVFAALSAIYGR